MERHRNAILGVYDSPIWMDWLAYLTALAIFAGIRGQPTMIDVVIAATFQVLLFGFIPGAIRRRVRQRRRERFHAEMRERRDS